MNLDPVIENKVNEQFEILCQGTTEIVPVDEFKKMLRNSITTNTPLRVKCGIDPTSKDVHLGHLVPYRKMRQFQDLGHTGVVIIGDYTARIGDPTGKNESRKSLDEETVKENAERYMEQVFTVLDKEKTEIKYQTEWFDKVNLRDVIGWASKTTVAKLLSHETFSERLDSGNPLSLHELFYPILQGIDSVEINADVELGGSDQKFNVLMGRDYQRANGKRPQVALLLPIITGTCGTQKMSKSLGNYIGILDEPFDKFGKIMSIPDKLIVEYYKYVAGADPGEVHKIEKGLKDGSIHPNESKKQLASKVVSFFHGESAGIEMREKFENVFAKKKIPDDVFEFNFKRGESVLNVLFEAGLFTSKAEIKRLLKQKAVGVVDGDKITDMDFVIDDSMKDLVLKIGKRKFVKLV